MAAEAGPGATPRGADASAANDFAATAGDDAAGGAELDDAAFDGDETGSGEAASDAVATNPADGAPSSSAGDAASHDAADPCDQDGDGHKATGPTCGGDDCCDTDSNAYPGQTAYFSTPTACGGYDYNCDGVATPQYGLANCQSSVLSCSGDGFDQVTACGVEAPFSVCASSGLLSPCTASVGTLTQACR